MADKLKETKTRISLVMGKDLHERLKEFSEERSVSISAVSSIAIAAFLDNMDISKKLMSDPEFVGRILDHRERMQSL